MTEMETLKKKKRDGNATSEDLTRLKLLQDGEQLSAADLEVAKKREEDRKAKDKADFEAKQAQKAKGMQAEQVPVKPETVMRQVPGPAPVVSVGPETETRGFAIASATLDVPAEHPRITAIKEALLPFTQIEAHDSRPNEFVLFTRGISITAGDVRKARKAMKL